MEEKPEWAMSAKERREKRAAEFRERQREQRAEAGRRAWRERQAALPSDVVVTHPDGSLEIVRRYSESKTDRIVSEGEVRLKEMLRSGEITRDMYEDGYSAS